MYEFKHLPAADTAAAVEARNNADDGQYLAGGQTLIPVLKQRLAMPSALIDLAGISDLKGISVDTETITIGAMTTHAEVAANADVRRLIPALADLAGGIGDPQVRNRGTIGGSVANSDPAADYPAAVLGLGATIRTDRREIAAGDFFTDLFETALEDGELITSVTFPVVEAAAYVKFDNPASRFAIVGVFVCKGSDGVRVAVTGAGPCVFRAEAIENAFSADFSPESLDDVSLAADGLNADMHASADYRAHLIGVLARRAVTKLI